LTKPDSIWWSGTSRDDVLKKSLADAAKKLIDELGPEPAKWTWGQIHTGTFKSQALGGSPVGFIFNRGPVIVDGGSAIINNTGGSFSVAYSNPTARLTDLFAERTVPSLRQIADLSNLNASRYIHTTGQSGLPTDPHYDDMIDPWRNIKYIPMWWDLKDVKANAEGTLTLTP
jgi:penicillin amidase